MLLIKLVSSRDINSNHLKEIFSKIMIETTNLKTNKITSQLIDLFYGNIEKVKNNLIFFYIFINLISLLK